MTPDSTAAAASARPFEWRASLRREVSVLLLLKAAALALLWWAFFSPAHRAPADAASVGRHLALEPAPIPGEAAAAATGGDQP